MIEHTFEFEVTITQRIGVTIEGVEWEEAQEYGDVEDIETLAREKAMRKAPVYLTREIADDGVAESSIELGELLEQYEYEY